MIDRFKILQKYSPQLTKIDYHSPLTIGNSSIAMTVDPTGLQTFADAYREKGTPLCTLSNWGWNSRQQVNLRDLTFTKYQTGITHETVAYPTDVPNGQADLYQALRNNPHRANLIQMGWTLANGVLQPSSINSIHQQLTLASGEITSHFDLQGQPVSVKTVVGKADTIGVAIESSLNLGLKFAFPNSSPQIDASDWSTPADYQTEIKLVDGNLVKVDCRLATLRYQLKIRLRGFRVTQKDKHVIQLVKVAPSAEVVVAMNDSRVMNFDQVEQESEERWHDYWSSVGFYDLDNQELERRVILSEYLLKAQDAGKLPPQESGLTVNSWSGKFHLEMTFWHEAWLALYHRREDLLPLIDWYQEILPQAKANAQANGYAGARWPKQVGPNGVNSPSKIAPLLLWQQPHLILMLEMLYQGQPSKQFLRHNWRLVKESAEFMADFLAEKDGSLHLQSPLVPSQERFGPNHVEDPTFELEYWRFGLKIAAEWASRLNKSTNWQTVADQIAPVDESYSTYVPVRHCDHTFSMHNTDHPTFIGIYGLIPTRMNPNKVKVTLDRVLKDWDHSSLWGWDYPMMAMVASKLGDFDLAVKILLLSDQKNTYLINGNNYQTRDLPLYLPGNGGLLLAMARLATDFPDRVHCENVEKWPW